MYYFYLVSFWFPFCCCCGGRIAVVHCGWPSEAKNLVHLDRHINIWWISGLIVVLMKCLWWLLSMIRIFVHGFVPTASFSVLSWNNSSYKLFRSHTKSEFSIAIKCAVNNFLTALSRVSSHFSQVVYYVGKLKEPSFSVLNSAAFHLSQCYLYPLGLR